MKKINYRKQESDLVDRLLQIVKSSRDSSRQTIVAGKVTDPATEQQLGLLKRFGIRPKWEATRMEAEEMIVHYKLVLSSAKRRPW